MNRLLMGMVMMVMDVLVTFGGVGRRGLVLADDHAAEAAEGGLAASGKQSGQTDA